ncbi:MAG: tetratricopeptide repeat protein [Planctomycetes bacterium]|nr:tetratricopeptide repeat protein [Planctomycetota bacterium]
MSELIQAETAYLFRHAMLRDAALQLHLPEEKVQLHQLALDLMESLLDAAPESARDAWAGELAEHARAAAAGLPTGHEALSALQLKEVRYLRACARVARQKHALAEAVRLLGRALELPVLTPGDIAELRYELGSILYGLSRYADAVHAIKPAMDIAQGEPLDQLLLLRARIHYDMGAIADGDGLLEQAMRNATARGDRRTVTQVLSAMGVPLSMRGMHAEAMRYYDAAVQAARQINDEPLLAAALANHSDSSYRMGQFKAAREEIEQSLALLRKQSDTKQLMTNLARYSIILDDLGERQLALQALTEANQIAREIGNQRMIAILRANYGTMEFESGRPESALKLYAEAETINREIGHMLGLTANITNRGGACRLLGDLPGALACAEEALAMARRMSHRELTASNLGKRGTVLLDMQRVPEALESLIEAEALLDESGVSLGFDRLTLAATRAQCLHLLGDHDAAKLHADRFRKIAAEMQIGAEHHTPLVAEAFVRVAEI